MGDKNAFGGGNARSLYVPMSDLEQEALSRLVSSGDLRVVIVGWGHIDRPRIVFGDARLSIQMSVDFNRPEIPIDVYYFDLELQTGAGMPLIRQRQPTLYGETDQPLRVGAGTHLDMVWDIAIQHMDPRLVKALVPGAIGLTSRLMDRDTGAFTLGGNMTLDPTRRRILETLRRGEAAARKDTQDRLRKRKDP